MKKLLTFTLFLMTLGTTFAQKNAVAPTVKIKTLKTKVSPQKVIDNYIKALGGREKLEAVKSTTQSSRILLGGVPLMTVTEKKMGNKFKNTQLGTGVDVINVFDGEQGYTIQNGQKTDFSAKKNDEMKKLKTFTALSLNAADYNAVEKISENGEVFFVLADKNGKFYFDTKDGLMWKSISSANEIWILSYNKSNGILYPEEMELSSQGLDMRIRVDEFVLNKDVSDADFK